MNSASLRGMLVVLQNPVGVLYITETFTRGQNKRRQKIHWWRKSHCERIAVERSERRSAFYGATRSDTLECTSVMISFGRTAGRTDASCYKASGLDLEILSGELTHCQVSGVWTPSVQTKCRIVKVQLWNQAVNFSCFCSSASSWRRLSPTSRSCCVFTCRWWSATDGQRTLSKMGNIKSVLRSTMGQQRLNILSLGSIERDVLRLLSSMTILLALKLARLCCSLKLT